MYKVIKRDGQIADFNINKIEVAITKAFEATNTNYVEDVIKLLALKVTANFSENIKDNLISVEDIQDAAENTLIECGYNKVAKAYILYRKQREKVRNVKHTMLDYKALVDSYVKATDWRVKENSTVTYSVGGLILSCLDYVPNDGTSLTVEKDGLVFEVIKVLHRRIIDVIVSIKEEYPNIEKISI